MKELITLLQRKLAYYERIEREVEKCMACQYQQQEGRLRVTNVHGTYQYYLCTKKGDTHGKYLRKDQRNIAEAIAQRDYDQQVLKCVTEWKKWLNKTIKCMPSTQLPDLYGISKGRQPLITPYEIPDYEYAIQWQKVPYEGKEFSPDAPEIYTERGERVRSKSEKMIADKLYMLGIPYRYEYPIRLAGYGTVYPDFLLLNQMTRKEIILEHFGMMDNPDYCDKAVKKINVYAKNGYVLGDNLLITFETTDTPMDMRVVEKILLKTELAGIKA